MDNVLFGGGILLESIRHSVDWQVGLIGEVEDVLDGIEDLLPEITLKAIVVLTLHMHDKLSRLLSGPRNSLNRANADSSLNCVLLDVVEAMIGEEERSILFDVPSIEFDDHAGEDDLFSALGLKVVQNCLILGAPHIILKVVVGSCFRLHFLCYNWLLFKIDTVSYNI